ncbi:MAG: hypothetical protein COX63_01520, partial [Candidatus Diapherotrites archaeon CG_4_10_14_0_2_um_filter_31_5]
ESISKKIALIKGSASASLIFSEIKDELIESEKESEEEAIVPLIGITAISPEEKLEEKTTERNTAKKTKKINPKPINNKSFFIKRS